MPTATSAAARQPGRVHLWLLAARPATLPAAAAPVFVGGAVAVVQGANFSFRLFAITLLSALFIQIGTNYANDYSDSRRGVDHEGRLGPLRVTQSGLLSEGDVRAGILAAFGVAALLGAYLIWVGGWPIAAIGVLSIAAGIAYTGGPWPFGYHALGDLFVLVFFGVIAVTGTAYLQTGSWSSLALVMSVPVGLLVTNILVVNNLRDRATDEVSGKRTLAVVLGDRRTRLQYALFTLLAYVIPVLLVAFSRWVGTWVLLPLLGAPLAAVLVARVLRGDAGRELNPMLVRTGQHLLLFSVLLVVGLLLTVHHS